MSIPTTPEALELARARYARYRQNEKYRQAQARYRASDKWKKAQSLYGRQARLTQPERIGARKAVRLAITYGMILPPAACQRCGAEGRLEAHHLNGYALSHWFDVNFLCGFCHKDIHWAERR